MTPATLHTAIHTAALRVLVDHRMLYNPEDGEYYRNEQYRHYLPGDIVTHEVAAPGAGRVTYKIVKTDARGAWGVEVRRG